MNLEQNYLSGSIASAKVRLQIISTMGSPPQSNICSKAAQQFSFIPDLI